MAGLLDLLLGSMGGASIPSGPASQQPPQAPPQSSSGFGYDPSGYLAPQQPTGQPGALVQQTAMAAPTSALVQPQAQPQAQPQDPNAPINITSNTPPDTWKPHKAGILGQISDYLLGTHFGRDNVRKNMEGAFEHLQSNPSEAINRLNKFDPEAAEALYEKNVTNQRLQGNLDRQNKVYDLSVDRMMDNDVSNMMYAAMKSSNPAAAYQAARNRAIMYGSRYGKDYSTIPEQYDPNDAQTYAMGGIPAAKQMAVSEQVRNHNFQHGDRAVGHQIARERNDILRTQGDTRLDIARTNSDTMGQNADTAAMNADTNRMRATDTVGRNTVRTVTAPGRPGHGQTVKGNPGQMIWYMPNGTQHLYLKGKDGNHWVYSHQMKGTDEKAKGVGDPDDNSNEN